MTTSCIAPLIWPHAQRARTALSSRWRVHGMAFFLACGAANSALAGAFSVTPVRIFMSPTDRAVAVTLVNEGNTPVVLQAELVQWRQDAQGHDLQPATDDLILSPPIIELAPQSKQVVRLARLVPADLSRQLTYRLIVREVPEVLAPATPVLQIPISLALSMPVFITPAGARHALKCELVAPSAGALGLQCHNEGTAHAQIREVQVSRDGQVLGQYQGGVYVLPGARKTVPITLATAVAPTAAQATAPVRVQWLSDDQQRGQLNTRLP